MSASRVARLRDELRAAQIAPTTRVVGVLAVTLLAAYAGLFWSEQRVAREVIATVSGTIAGQVAEDGTFVVTEELLVEAVPRSGPLERVIPAPAGGHIRLISLRTESGLPVEHTLLQTGQALVVRLPDVDPAGLYALRYEVAGAVSAHADVAELDWPILDARSRLVFSDLTVDAAWLAGAGEPLVVDVEAHGPSGPAIPRDGGVRWEAGRRGAHTPTALTAAFQLLAVTQLDPGSDERLEVMTADAEEDAPSRGGQGGGPAVIPVVLALAYLGAWAVVHRLKGREHRVPIVGDVARPPSAHPAAEVGWLLRFGNVGPTELAATIVDLAERGHLAIDTHAGVFRAVSERSEREDLRPHEARVLDWLFSGGATELVIADRTAAIRADPDSWRSLWQDFVTEVDARGRRDGLVERSADAESVLGVGVLSASVMVAGVVGTAAGQPWWIACIVGGALVLAFADTLARRSVAGAEAAARWTAFGRHLGSAVPVAAGTGMPAHAGYGLVLGVAPPMAGTPAAVALDAVARWRSAFVTATSFRDAPSAALMRRVRELVRPGGGRSPSE